jgi:hypothetical protein
MEKRATLTVEIFDPEQEAARAAQKAVLEEIYLVDAQTWRDPLVSSPEVLTLEHKFSREIIVPDENDEEYEDAIDRHFTLCKFRVIAFNEKLPNKPLIKIEATFLTSFTSKVGDYQGTVNLDSEESSDAWFTYQLTYLHTVNPISTAWPYWREFVQSMSTRMGYPVLTVPMLEIVLKKTPPREAKNQPVRKQVMRRKKVNA